MAETRNRVNMGVDGGVGALGISERIAARSDIAAWRLCSVTGGTEPDQDLRLLK